MGSENSKGEGAVDNPLLHDVAGSELQPAEGIPSLTNGQVAKIFDLVNAGNAAADGRGKAKTAGVPHSIVTETDVDDEEENEERVIEIDEYTKKMTIIRENVYHYVGLVSGREYAKEMGLEEAEKHDLPQAPMEFLLQGKKKKEPVSSIQSEGKTLLPYFLLEKTKEDKKTIEISKASGDQIIDNTSDHKEIGNNQSKQTASEMEEEVTLKNLESTTTGVNQTNSAQNMTKKEADRIHLDGMDQDDKEDKTTRNGPKSIIGGTGSNSNSEESTISYEAEQSPMRNNGNSKPGDMTSGLARDGGTLSSTISNNNNESKEDKDSSRTNVMNEHRDAQNGVQEPSTDSMTRLVPMSTCMKELNKSESWYQSEPLKRDSQPGNSFAMTMPTSPGLESAASGASESKQVSGSGTQPIYSTMMIVGPRRKAGNPVRQSSINSQASLSADDEKINRDESEADAISGKEVNRHGHVTQSLSNSPNDDTLVTSELESNVVKTETAKARESTGRSNDKENGSYLPPIQVQIISTIHVAPNRRNSDDLEHRSASVTNLTSDEYTLNASKPTPPSNMSSSGNADHSSNAVADKMNQEKQTNGVKVAIKSKGQEFYSKSDGLKGSLPEGMTWKKTFSGTEAPLIYADEENGEAILARKEFESQIAYPDGRNNNSTVVMSSSIISSTNRMRCELSPSENELVRKEPSSSGQIQTNDDDSAEIGLTNDSTEQIDGFGAKMQPKRESKREFDAAQNHRTENSADLLATGNAQLEDVAESEKNPVNASHKDNSTDAISNKMESKSPTKTEIVNKTDDSADIQPCTAEPVYANRISSARPLQSNSDEEDGSLDPDREEGHSDKVTCSQDHEKDIEFNRVTSLNSHHRDSLDSGDWISNLPEHADDQQSTSSGPKAAQRTISLLNDCTQTPGAGNEAAPEKHKSISRSRSVGFRDPEVIPDIVTPIRTIVPPKASPLKTALKPFSERKSKIPSVTGKVPSQVLPSKTSLAQESKSALVRKETTKKPVQKAATVPTTSTPTTIHESGAGRRSSIPQATSSPRPSSLRNSPTPPGSKIPGNTRRSSTPQPPAPLQLSSPRSSSGPRIPPSPKSIRKKEESKSSLQKNTVPSKSLECIPRCTCLQISGKSFSRSISGADPAKYGTLTKQKSCEALSHARHPDNPMGLREYGFTPPSKKPHWR